MSSRSYSIVEPHPNPSSSHYISTGRGGAGNAIRTSSHNITRGADATGPAAAAAIRASLASSSSKPASTTSATQTYSMGGRGGAGNFFPSSERTIFSFDEELERQLRWERDVAPVYHVGRGGAGNLIHGTTSAQKNSNVRRMSDDSGASLASVSSHGSESGADVFNRGVKKGWKKIVGGH